MNYNFDACALIAFLNDEEGADAIEKILTQSSANDDTLSMSVINLLEVYYAELRDKGSDIAQVVLDMAHHYSIKIVDTVSEQAFKEAARLKAAYKMSLADCIGLATTLETSSQFVTSDHHEFDTVAEKEAFPIFWFR